MGTFRSNTVRRLFIALGVLVALYMLFVMVPISPVPKDVNGIPKSTLRIGIEGRLHFLGIL